MLTNEISWIFVAGVRFFYFDERHQKLVFPSSIRSQIIIWRLASDSPYLQVPDSGPVVHYCKGHSQMIV